MFVVIGVAFEAKIISLPKLGSVRREKVSWNQNMLHQSLAPAARDLVGPSVVIIRKSIAIASNLQPRYS